MTGQGVKGNAIPFGRVKRRQLLIWVQGRSIPAGGSRVQPRPGKSDENRHFVLGITCRSKSGKIHFCSPGSFAGMQFLKKGKREGENFE